MNNNLDQVKWGIIGCGDVCEVKSGPAFNKIPNSSLVAVMRRDAEKAADYAKRHHVNKFYTDAKNLIEDPDVNAIYIATPPASHELYAEMAISAGKPVYIEKPLSIDSESTQRIADFATKHDVKASGAYYRRKLPLFEKVKEIIKSNELGNISLIAIRLLLPNKHNGIAQTATNWRIDPSVSGGGLFHDLAPHMLDIIYWIFGTPLSASGKSFNQAEIHAAPDLTYLNATFQKGEVLNGVWSFHTPREYKEDICQIIGDKGSLKFSFFELNPLEISIGSNHQSFEFTNPENIQLNMIRDVVKYFRGEGENPCSITDTLESMKMIDSASK